MLIVDILSPCGGGKSGIEKVLSSWKKITHIKFRFIHLGLGIEYLEGYDEAYEYKVYDPSKNISEQLEKMAMTYANFIKVHGKPMLCVALNYPIMSKVVKLSQQYLINNSEAEFKIVSWVHNDVNMYNSVGLGGIEELKEADYHLCINKAIIKQLKQDGVNDDKIYYIANPIVFPKEDYFEKINYVNGDVRKKSNKLIYVGRVSAEKRLDIILEAMYRAKSDWSIKIIGDGDYKKELFEIISYLQMDDKVKYLGWKDNPWDYLEDEVALVAASDYEGFLLVGAEALAYGRMVLSTPTVIDYIQEGVNGYFFNNEDGVQLAEILDKIANGEISIPDPRLCRESVAQYEEKNYIKAVEISLLYIIKESVKKNSEEYFELVSSFIDCNRIHEVEEVLKEAFIEYPLDYRWYYIKGLLAENGENFEEQLVWLIFVKILKEINKEHITKEISESLDEEYYNIRNKKGLVVKKILNTAKQIFIEMINLKSYDVVFKLITELTSSSNIDSECRKIFIDREILMLKNILEIGLMQIKRTKKVVYPNDIKKLEDYNCIDKYKDDIKGFYEVFKEVRFYLERMLYGIPETSEESLAETILKYDVTPEMLLLFIREMVPLLYDDVPMYEKVAEYLKTSKKQGKNFSDYYIEIYYTFVDCIKKLYECNHDEEKKKIIFKEKKEKNFLKKIIVNLDKTKSCEIIDYERKIEKNDILKQGESTIVNYELKEWNETQRLINKKNEGVEYDEKKIAIIFCTNDNRMRLECEAYIKTLDIPKDFSLEVIEVINAKSMASGYNAAILNTNAKYKLYIHHDVWLIEENILIDAVEVLQQNQDVNLLGVAGSAKINKNGFWFEKRDIDYGFVKVVQNHEAQTVESSHIGKNLRIIGKANDNIILYSAKAIDGVFLFTNKDVPWREDIFDHWHYYDISECIEYIYRGYKCAFWDNGKVNIHHYVTVDTEADVVYRLWREAFLKYVKEVDENLLG
ncbi:glycosyltransferase [Lachnobacterium bovis]|uniref:glycosyltransferase n=1 Tax=Lachnobacterium bovis TaxID=140626 RepID=UPI0003B3E39D|nr:glycosyltransferase [Lachnobacterium bovis]